MTLPTFSCPVCRNVLTIETVFAHEGVRDAIQALANLHPQASLLMRPTLGYVGLFAPAKTAMRYERIASLLTELTAMIRSAQIERNGQTYVAPMDYFRMAMEEMLSRRDAGALRLPLSSHGYLLEIIVGYCTKAEAAAEKRLEAQRAGHAGVGSNPARAAQVPQPDQEKETRARMPEDIRAELERYIGKTVITGGKNGNEKKD
jgi:hypothetical protein